MKETEEHRDGEIDGGRKTMDKGTDTSEEHAYAGISSDRSMWRGAFIDWRGT